MRTLYVFPTSPFSRRVRLALMHKRLDVKVLDARADAALHEEAKKRWPLQTVPVLVDEGGGVLGDSTAIVHYLEEAYPEGPRLWPTNAEQRRRALWTAQLVDGALNGLIDLATRYGALRGHAEWAGVEEKMLGRAQAALDALGETVSARGPRPITDAGWCAPDMFLVTMTIWMESLPERAKDNEAVAKIVSYPWSLPSALSRWAEAFRERDDVRALGPTR